MLIKQEIKEHIDKGSSLYNIYEKVMNNARVSVEDALTLYNSNDIISIGKIANIIQRRYNCNKAYYVLNGHINYSNLCELSCTFCSFSTKEGDADSYSMSLEEIDNKFLEYNQNRIKEIHIVGALNKNLDFDYYLNMLFSIRKLSPDITIKAFTAVEIDFFSRRFSMSVKDVLTKLMDAGLRMLPGGGAEVFSSRVRKKICKDKIMAEEWLNIHKEAHLLGIKSNATMLFGHIETIEERIEHLNLLRELQDETNGFLSFIPLTYHPDYNFLKSQRTSPIDELKTIAISRIFLDNFPHIKAYWVMLGLKLTQLALSFGADDLDGTILEEKITHKAGAKTPLLLSRKEIVRLIEETGKEAIQRDSYYKEVDNK